MSKLTKGFLFALLAMAALGILALVVFSGDKEEEGTGLPPPLVSEQPAVTPVVTMPDPALITLTPSPGMTATSDLTSVSPSAPMPVSVPTPPGRGTSQVVTYEIQNGDMISKVASKYGCKSTEIYELNEGLNAQTATKIRPGQKIRVLDKRGLGSNTTATIETTSVSDPGKSLVSSSTTATTPTPTEEPKAPMSPEPPALHQARVHKLAKGDTIFTLATQYYGAPKYFTMIRKANPDWNPVELDIGREIIIPALNDDKASISSTPVSSPSNEIKNASRNPIPPRK